MPNLRIIYTPEASYFRRDDIDIHHSMNPKDEAVIKLRENYARLRERVPDLPLKVGVVSYPEIFKRHSLESFSMIDNPTTTYTPLDILEQALALRNVDVQDSLKKEFVYRTLSYLIENPAVLMDDNLGKKRLDLILSFSIPDMELIKIEYQKLKRKLVGNAEFVKLCDRVIEATGHYPTWDSLQQVYDYILMRFKKNRVSREFPLIFLPPNLFYSEMFLVTLTNKIETPDYIPKVLEYIRLGCKAQGLKDVPEHMMKELMAGQRDLFGETQRVEETSIDKLLETLPEPKTVITDIYIIDRFPELAEINFETFEYDPFKVT